ncbi:MAG: phosphodiester glycosidase family protein [Desulfobacterales bacterium]|nr:phosphodiester glycosidase family protein [Desulfobacterales bacterium]
MKLTQNSLLILIYLLAISVSVEAQPIAGEQKSRQKLGWQQLDRGLELGTFLSPQPAEVGDSLVRVLRINPKYYRLRLLNASAIENGVPLTPKQWCRQNGLIAAINPSMFQTDYKTSVSLMRTQTHTNNPRLSKDMTILAFDRQSSDVPRAKIIDRQCEDFQFWKKKYKTLVQSIRMLSCKGKNVWKQQQQKWSTAAIAIDGQENILFIHVRSWYSTHDLINVLKKLPLNISKAMYTEGGPQAQLYINTGEKEFEFVGSYETSSPQNNENAISWPLPNVIGISVRTLQPNKQK